MLVCCIITVVFRVVLCAAVAVVVAGVACSVVLCMATLTVGSVAAVTDATNLSRIPVVMVAMAARTQHGSVVVVSGYRRWRS